ncbi:MAG: hypothetical protein A2Z99_09625 [Treponema sp. GWB1_62_6]|nr:MAG: hypothetical protein A2Y36_08640 [Treponema sp. GWA1_62_8]OHE64819.1 MAG: hypothetical protein A2001_04715 [Treponema sp. GWC1_61_84]OHE68416.1 MAG: hypothetical protein A2Z99_09625 [Treponema sp. GWB1_62_6]OHE72594.1 MAG: hypothetical protein A2413_07510 [Treponema sp. RIFOXYC1_FULL_61_9]HCM27664.1 hypothetical protein [Treponema sp.]
MSFARPVLDEVIPDEYRTIAGELFSDPGVAARTYQKDVERFAEVLGIIAEFRASCASSNSPANAAVSDRRLLGHFRNNVELLIQKTWVEKADEAHKEKLLDRIPVFVLDMERADYERALRTFIHILDELAYLLFGTQSRKGDFIEYAFRIDANLGLFWWYAGNLASLLGETDEKRIRAVLVIGVCYLSSI